MKKGKSFSGRERHCCFLNTGSAEFADVSSVSGFDFADDGRGLALVDWDADGDLDMWLTNRSGPMLRFLRNDFPIQRKFLAIRLVGTTCNRDAIGARVEVFLAGQESPLVKTLRAGESFLSQSSKWLHFGCGDATAIDRLLVHWPGGNQQIYRGLQLGRRYRLTEGEAQPSVEKPREQVLSEDPQPVVLPEESDTIRLATHAPISLPRMSFEDSDGQTTFIGDVRGRPLLVNLWASWCNPCVSELTEFTERKAELREAGLNVLALSVDRFADPAQDTSSKARAILQQLEFPFLTGWADPPFVDKAQMVNDLILDLYEPIPVPTSMLLDANGDLFALYKGPVEVDQLLEDVAKIGLQGAARREASIPFAGRWIAPYRKLHFIDLAFSLAAHGYETDALQFYSRHSKMLASHGQSPRLFVVLGNALLGQGSESEAIKFYRAALGVVPGHVQAADRLAWVLSTSADERVRNGDEALRLAKLAVQNSGTPNPAVLDTLAAAFAEKGDFDNARNAAKAASELARSLKMTKLSRDIESRIEVYQNNLPYRRVDGSR